MRQFTRQYSRSARFNSLLQEEISDIIRRRLKDPRIGMASISRVDVTGDLRSAKIYVSVLEESKESETLAALKGAAGVIRSELLHRLRVRRVPELRFLLERNIAYSVHISEVLSNLEHESDDAEEDDE